MTSEPNRKKNVWSVLGHFMEIGRVKTNKLYQNQEYISIYELLKHQSSITGH